MFLHLGGDILIDKNKILAILNLETSTNKSEYTQEFINNLKKENIYYTSSKGKEKSFIITTDGYYFSPISSTTLLKRSINSLNFLDKEE